MEDKISGVCSFNASADELVEWAYNLEALGGMLSDMVLSDIRVEDFRWNIGRLGRIIQDYAGKLRFNLDEAYAGGDLKELCDNGGDATTLGRLRAVGTTMEENTGRPRHNVSIIRECLETTRPVDVLREMIKWRSWLKEAEKTNLQQLAEGQSKKAHAASKAA